MPWCSSDPGEAGWKVASGVCSVCGGEGASCGLFNALKCVMKQWQQTSTRASFLTILSSASNTFILVCCVCLLLKKIIKTSSILLSYTLLSLPPSSHPDPHTSRVSRCASECCESLFRATVSNLWAARNEGGPRLSHGLPALTSTPAPPPALHVLSAGVSVVLELCLSNIVGPTLPLLLSWRSYVSG